MQCRLPTRNRASLSVELRCSNRLFELLFYFFFVFAFAGDGKFCRKDLIVPTAPCWGQKFGSSPVKQFNSVCSQGVALHACARQFGTEPSFAGWFLSRSPAALEHNVKPMTIGLDVCVCVCVCGWLTCLTGCNSANSRLYNDFGKSRRWIKQSKRVRRNHSHHKFLTFFCSVALFVWNLAVIVSAVVAPRKRRDAHRVYTRGWSEQQDFDRLTLMINLAGKKVCSFGGVHKKKASSTRLCGERGVLL